MLEIIISGIIQGIFEWLPVSSEGLISLLLTNLGYSLQQSVDVALFLHIGTLLATISFFWKDIKEIAQPKTAKAVKELSFIIWTTIISLLIGGPLYIAIQFLSVNFADKVNLLIGSFLIITGLIQLFRKNFNTRNYNSVDRNDGIITGVAQGFSILPGISRSGSTTLALIIKGFNVESALKLSFFASIPVIFIAQLASGLKNGFMFNPVYLIGALVAFAIGRITIKYLLNIAEKINFSTFCIVFGVLAILL